MSTHSTHTKNHLAHPGQTHHNLKMKKTRPLFYSSLLALLLAPNTLKAQEVYNMVLENATQTVNSPSKSFTQVKIAQFKSTALVYLKKKAFENSKEVKEEFLNTQAYYLSEFIFLFFTQILKDHKLSDEERRKKIYLFMDASLSNPLFNDPDTETTQSYIKEGSELTPFSLDTDWQKAWHAAKSQL